MVDSLILDSYTNDEALNPIGKSDATVKTAKHHPHSSGSLSPSSFSPHRFITSTTSRLPITRDQVEDMALGASPARVTPYLIYLVFITTLGPLQFGYHLVRNTTPTLVLSPS